MVFAAIIVLSTDIIENRKEILAKTQEFDYLLYFIIIIFFISQPCLKVTFIRSCPAEKITEIKNIITPIQQVLSIA